jgi:hypothetical protein
MKSTCAKLSLLLAVAFGASGYTHSALQAPGGIPWGASPGQALAILARQYKFVGPQPAEGNPDEFLHEQRYTGNVLGIESDHIAPMFYIGQFFGLAVSFSPKRSRPASLIWYELLDKLTAQYGPPQSRTKPRRLVSKTAILKMAPDEANKGSLLSMYNAADRPRDVGEFLLLDLQVKAGDWVPEAVWEFKNGAAVKAVMRATGPDKDGIRQNLKPAVVYSKYDLFK